MLGLRLVWTTPKQEFCGFLHRSPDYIRLGTSVACLSDAVPGRPAGGGSGCGLGGSRLDHHLGAERADPRRRAEAWMGAAGRGRGRLVRRRIGFLDRTPRPARNPQRVAVVELSTPGRP